MEQTNSTPTAARSNGRWKLLAVLAVCASPLIFSYLTYYVIKPTARNNYGDLIEPQQHPMPALAMTELDGKPASPEAWKGKWVMLQVAPGACDKQCTDQLIAMRQLRLMQGKAQDRVERVWLVPDQTPLSIELMKWIDGTRILRVQPASLGNWLPVAAGGKLQDHIYVIDPLGNLMMRFPKEADPKKVSKDLGKLLKASAIG